MPPTPTARRSGHSCCSSRHCSRPARRSPRSLSATAPTWSKGPWPEAAWLFAADVARVPGPLLDALTAAGDDAAADPAEAVGCLHDLEAMAHDDTEMDRWADVDVPVLLLQGEKTWAPVPATMDALAAVLPSVTRVVLAGQAHFATHTAPALFAQAVTKFLAAT